MAMKRPSDFLNTSRPDIVQPAPGQSFLRDQAQAALTSGQEPWANGVDRVDWEEWESGCKQRQNFREHTEPGGQTFDFDKK